MTEGLKRYALYKERNARTSATRPDARNHGTLPAPRDKSAAGVKISNEGGYQSYPDCFDYVDIFPALPPQGRTWAEHKQHQEQHPPAIKPKIELNAAGLAEFGEEDVWGRRHLHELHNVASVAVDAIYRSTPKAPPAEGEGAQGKKVAWGEHEVHVANAWINVSRAKDTNIMHVHTEAKWSATYYVAASPESKERLDGRLVFRAGPKRRAGGQPATASHSFMTVPPVPGTLWLFPGSVPHRVLGMSRVSGGIGPVLGRATRREWAPRVSVAMNFMEATASSTRVPAVALMGY